MGIGCLPLNKLLVIFVGILLGTFLQVDAKDYTISMQYGKTSYSEF